MVFPVNKHVQLRSFSYDLLFVPKVNTNVGRSIVILGLRLLLLVLIGICFLVNWKCCKILCLHLKTYLYNNAYPPLLPVVSTDVITTGIIYW